MVCFIRIGHRKTGKFEEESSLLRWISAGEGPAEHEKGREAC